MTNTFLQDWGYGFANMNQKTGIHYGAISNNSVSQEALDVNGDGWKDLSYEYALNEAKRNWEAGDHGDEDEDAEFDEDAFNEGYMNDGDSEYAFDDGEYAMESCLDNDWLVTKSPYYTYAAPCSPCVPNAGDLDTPRAGGFKTYCLGLDFFDEYAPCEYPVYDVKTDEYVGGAPDTRKPEAEDDNA